MEKKRKKHTKKNLYPQISLTKESIEQKREKTIENSILREQEAQKRAQEIKDRKQHEMLKRAAELWLSVRIKEQNVKQKERRRAFINSLRSKPVSVYCCWYFDAFPMKETNSP